jgi:hypothetical protein
MKESLLQRRGRMSLISNVRILELWNSIACSVHAGPLSYDGALSEEESGGYVISLHAPYSHTKKFGHP